MTSSSPHLAMFGYQRAISAPAGAGGSQPALVGVDPKGGQTPGFPTHLSSPGYEMRPHTISSAYERYHARSTVSAATFEPPPPPPPPPALRAPPPPSVICRSSSGPGPTMICTHLPAGPPARMTRSQRPQRHEVIYQSVLRTPGSPQQLQQQTVDNGTCDTTTGMPRRSYVIVAVCLSLSFTFINITQMVHYTIYSHSTEGATALLSDSALSAAALAEFEISEHILLLICIINCIFDISRF